MARESWFPAVRGCVSIRDGHSLDLHQLAQHLVDRVRSGNSRTSSLHFDKMILRKDESHQPAWQETWAIQYTDHMTSWPGGDGVGELKQLSVKVLEVGVKGWKTFFSMADFQRAIPWQSMSAAEPKRLSRRMARWRSRFAKLSLDPSLIRARQAAAPVLLAWLSEVTANLESAVDRRKVLYILRGFIRYCLKDGDIVLYAKKMGSSDWGNASSQTGVESMTFEVTGDVITTSSGSFGHLPQAMCTSSLQGPSLATFLRA